MKKWLVIFCFLFVGCSYVSEKHEVVFGSEREIPPHVILSDAKGDLVGMAVPIQEGIFVTADHLLEGVGDLFWGEKKLEVLGRSFDHNVVFVQIKEASSFIREIKLADGPPAVGGTIFWLDGKKILHERVRNIRGDWIEFFGENKDATAGSPVFSEKGEVLGILVSGDLLQNIFRAVRIDAVVQFFNESSIGY